jgi:apolipoprotein N-acyltransferase
MLFGLAFGAARYAVAAHFLLALCRYSAPLGIAVYLLSILYILPSAVVEAWGAFVLERRCGLPRSLGFALLYPLTEWVRTFGDLSFPADDLAHAFGRQPAWLALAPWTGPFGVTLLVLATAALLDAAVERRGRQWQAVAIALAGLALWLVPPAASLFLDRGESGRESVLRIGIVQPAVDVREKLDRRRWPATWARLTEMTLSAARGADLVLWPETARPGRVIWTEPDTFHDVRMEELATRAGVPILYGCEIARVLKTGEIELYNGAALARPGGGASDWYGKQRLLPLVEGIPLAGWIGMEPSKRVRSHEPSELSLLGNFTPGPRSTVFEVGPARIGVLICFEGMYAALARRYRVDGVNLLCVLTNDAWWGRSAFAPWHARMISARARECDLPVVRAANDGVSSSTDRRGVMGDATRLDETAILRTEVRIGSGAPTFYARHGNLVIGAELAFLAAVVLRAVGRRRTSNFV